MSAQRDGVTIDKAGPPVVFKDLDVHRLHPSRGNGIVIGGDKVVQSVIIQIDGIEPVQPFVNIVHRQGRGCREISRVIGVVQEKADVHVVVVNRVHVRNHCQIGIAVAIEVADKRKVIVNRSVIDSYAV